MKSSAPWSVKGIKRDARETAKQAARREGMTVGEWLNQVIYSAGEPETSDGDIEGLKTSDLVTAIEHLNKRVIAAESKGAAAIEDLARNIGGALERLQRLERTRPSDGAPSLEERLRRLESRAGDGQRIKALQALEKAVAQVALQYDAAHKTTLTRLEASERQLQELASRLDSAAAEGAAEPAGVSTLRETVDGLARRLEKAERIAAEAAEMKSEASDSVDAEFVERTGARLRILGDEIKRGGDQIRTLESLIKKLSDQIDAAERRSSEGVQKVSETISQLRSQFSQPEASDGGDNREEIEAAMAEVTRRTETRINELQHSFEAMIARLETPQASVPALEPKTPREHEDAALDDDGAVHASDESDIHSIFGDGEEPDSAAASRDEDEDEDAFTLSFDDSAAPADAAGPTGADSDEEETAPVENVETAPLHDEDDEPASVDAMFAGFDDEAADPEGSSPTSATGDAGEDAFDDPLSALVADRDDGADAVSDNSPRHGEPAASEGEKSSSPQMRRRNLTPKQRALLAAKIRRKRLAKQGLSVSTEPAPEPAVTATDSGEAGDEERKSVFNRAAGALTAFRKRHHDDANASDETTESEATQHIDTRPSEDDGSPNFARAILAALNRIGVRPVTLALGAAILLAAAALFFVARDIVSGSVQTAPAKTSAPAAETAEPAATADEAAAEASTSVPAAPEAPVAQPRALYLESVAELEAAKTEGDTRTALKLLQQAAALGHPPAQLQLGELYKLGQGVEQNPAQARIWYERAAAGGNVLAMHRAGVMAARGQGGVTDLDAAIDWFTKAANFGLVDSQYNLGATYHPASNGSSNPIQDAAEAYYWYALAARNGDEQAKTLAAGLATGLTPDERRTVDERIANWTAQTPDQNANEIASAS